MSTTTARHFDGYEPAYRAGCEGFRKHAARASWHHVERALRGDFDRDGRRRHAGRQAAQVHAR